MPAEKIDRTIAALLEALGLASLSLLADLRASWPDLVGPLLARRSRPERLKAGTLTIRVPTHVWAQEMSMERPLLLDRIGARFGSGKVSDLRFQVGAMSEEGGEEPGDVGGGSAPPGEGAEPGGPPPPAGIDRLEDPEIRRVLAAIARRAAARKG